MTEDYEKLKNNNSPEHSVEKPVKKKRKKKVVKDDNDSSVVENEMSPAEITDELISPRADKPKKKKKKPPQVIEEPIQNESQVENIPMKKMRKKKVIQDESLGVENEISPAEATDEVISPRSPKADKPKKKKKKKPPGDETSENQVEEINDVGTSEPVEGEPEQPVPETPRKMKRKKKKPKEETEEVTQPEAEELSPREIEDEGQILAVMIHRTDKLKNNFYIQHPLVRVHIVDQITGHYLTKQHQDRAVTSYYETRADHLEQILPIMTQPFVFRQQKSTLPVWEELLVFNENFNYFIQERPQVIVFFELIDFVSMNKASRQYEDSKSSGGWHRIAWAFLKIFGGNKELNVDKKVRLQLFEPPNNYRLKTSQVELFQWWQNTVRESYPSTLYVTIKGITSPNMVEPSTRSMFPTQEELGKMTYEDLQRSMNFTTKTHEESTRPLTSWNRLLGQTCRIPNHHMMSLKAGRKGCFVLKFSHDGRSLACACRDTETYPIMIYEIPSGKLLGELTGHFGIVYDLCWSRRDTQLLSASNDGTARIWNVKKFLEDQVLPHPTFVYTAQFHPKNDSVIVTGAFDQVIRVWDVDGENEDDFLKQEIEDHQGHVNSVCFDEEGEKLYSADSKGVIMVWNAYVADHKSRRGFITNCSKYQEIKEPSIKDTPINYLKMHPSGRKLLVHCRDNIIRLFDLRVQRVIQYYIGSLNFREKLRSAISPCGTFVFAGSEDNIAYVWNTDSGDQVAKYSELNYNQPVTDIEYHPRDHIIALCSIGENQPVLLYKYNPNTALLEAGVYPSTAEDSDTQDEALVSTARTMESPRRTHRKDDSTLISQSQAFSPEPTSARVLTKDQFYAHETNRYQNVLKKLETVTLGGDPTLFSPHAPPSMSSVMQQQTFNSQSLYMKDADSSWRPGFSDIGRKSGASHIYQGRLPQFSLTQSQGKAQFSFQAPVGRSPPKKMVVAICDYKGQRSDELSVFKGDVIRLLYKDSANWWMGELANGQQGYFPANYVTVEGEEDEEGEEESNQVVRKKDRKKKVVHMK